MGLYLFCYIYNGTNQSYKNDTKIQDIPTVSKVILKESRDDDKFTSRTPGSGKEVDKTGLSLLLWILLKGIKSFCSMVSHDGTS